MSAEQYGLGVVGAGGFAAFATDHFLEIESLRLIAVSDIDATRANNLASAHGARLTTVEEMLSEDAVDVIYVATPPSSHADLAIRALKAGKHVLCEKPLATTLEDADSVVELAVDSDRFAVANLLQRYNPLAGVVRTVVERQLLGEPLYASVENLASDEALPPEHWFWDPALSGGIFIEHAVHFFDLFGYWFGSAEIESASHVMRPETGAEEQVRCTARYAPVGTPVLVDSYHGFHQPTCLDRMRTRLVFEHGELSLGGWIPTTVELDCITDTSGKAALLDLFGSTGVTENALSKTSGIHGRHKPIAADRHLHIRAGSAADKMTRYGQLVTDLMRDQLQWVHDRNHQRHLNENDSREAVRLAAAATALARANTDRRP
jgi:predicted dehydrogenase